MTVGDRLFTGKGAREEAAKALTYVVLSWRDDAHLEVRARFRGFEILSRGKRSSAMTIDGSPPLPDLFLKGSGIYAAHLNAENPLGTVQSLEHALRALDKLAAQEQDHISRLEKTLSDYQTQANRPFEQEARLKELQGRQAQLHAALDLDKGERQAAEPTENEGYLRVPEANRSLAAEPQENRLAHPQNTCAAVGPNIAKGEENGKSGPQSQRDEVADSLTAAQSVTARAHGDGAQMRTPQTGSGIYRGVILGETTHHVIQGQSAHSGIAHRKDLLNWQPRAGEHVRIQYANAKGTVRKCHEHARGEELGR
jgi:hypothetical protein